MNTQTASKTDVYFVYSRWYDHLQLYNLSQGYGSDRRNSARNSSIN